MTNRTRLILKVNLVAILLGALIGGAAARSDSPFRPRPPQRFVVGPSMTGKVWRGASITGGTYTVVRNGVVINADGSQVVGLIYTNASNQLVSTKTILIDSACSHAVDNLGNVISTPGPTSECTAATTFTSSIDSTIGTAASGGKLNL